MVLINANSTALNIGDPMPHFSLPATDGLTIHSKEIKDPVLVVIFTCNHCPYAQAYEERIQTLAEDLDPTSASHSAKATRDKKATVGRQEGVQFVLINANDATNYPEDDFEHMKEKVKKNCYSFPYCHDA
jgi:peroxiredoxin